LANCELTHLARTPIDLDVARAQHAAYEQALQDAGCTVERLAAAPEMPDSVFIEDIAVVLDEVAIITRPGAESRRLETAAVAGALSRHRSIRTIASPGTVDGGDVLVVGRRVFIGRTTRTNDVAIEQMRTLLSPFGYTVCAVAVSGCLHLKSAVTALRDDLLLANRASLEMTPFDAFEIVDVDPSEPMAGNALRLDDWVVYPTAFPRTAERIAGRGFPMRTVDVSELAKAEGAVTCCCVIVR
jgi:dimethylargininase